MPYGFWGWFYMIAVILTVIHAILPGCNSGLRRGALVIGLSWLASAVSRDVLGSAAPLAFYALIDVFVGLAMASIAIQNKAIWAALCVVLHALMGILHVAQFLSGGDTVYAYLVILNGLFLLSLITLNLAILAARYEWASRLLDVHFLACFGWRFSGSGDNLPANHSRKAR